MQPRHSIFALTVLIFCLCTVAFAVGGSSSAGNHNTNNADKQHINPTQDTVFTVAPITQNSDRTSFLSWWVHLHDSNEYTEIEDSSVIAFAPEVPRDLARIFKTVGTDSGKNAGLLPVLLLTAISICTGFLVAFAVERVGRKELAQFEKITSPDNGIATALWSSIIHNIPALASVILMALSSTIVFSLFAEKQTVEARMLFQIILGTVLIIRICSIVSRVIFAPGDKRLRSLAIDDSLAKPISYAFSISSSFALVGSLVIYFIKDLGALDQTVSWVIIIMGSAVIAVLTYLVLYLRKPIANSQHCTIQRDNENCLKEHLATYWHVPTLFYLLVVWLVWIGQELVGTTTNYDQLITNLLIVPFYFLLRHAGRVLISSVVYSLGLSTKNDNQIVNETDGAVNEHESSGHLENIVSKSHFVFRVILFASLASWLLSSWGYTLPFAATAVKAFIESLVTVALAIVCWRVVSSYITKKIEEATSDTSIKDESSDDEFGKSTVRGRSYTLLPVARKVLGSILVIMVILIVLDSFGINIGPLLAGAGVIGIAVGFGARKLVADILSGFFFLLDDAFRVGEYIQTGSIRGTVESISLRNVMLRHHLGMLQIVPHSDLGAVTNYMRGGIVIKFRLEFPYNTDIDKVRRIIKKVGQAMLEDEEYGNDFINPLKSQGVYEISNSVMVIRAKFTAKPGKQFLIKREAYRRLSEAFSSNGLDYAHRKIIVDYPDDHSSSSNNENKHKAGAAAIMTTEIDQQEKLEKENRDQY
jgi:small-conductance mechanosensitive channel